MGERGEELKSDCQALFCTVYVGKCGGFKCVCVCVKLAIP